MSFLLAALLMAAAAGLIFFAFTLSLHHKTLQRFMEAVERGDVDVAIFESERVPSGRIESVVGTADRRHFRLSITTDFRRAFRSFRLFVDSARFRARRVPVDDIKHPFSLMYLKLKRLLKRRGIKTG